MQAQASGRWEEVLGSVALLNLRHTCRKPKLRKNSHATRTSRLEVVKPGPLTLRGAKPGKARKSLGAFEVQRRVLAAVGGGVPGRRQGRRPGFRQRKGFEASGGMCVAFSVLLAFLL